MYYNSKNNNKKRSIRFEIYCFSKVHNNDFEKKLLTGAKRRRCQIPRVARAVDLFLANTLETTVAGVPK